MSVRNCKKYEKENKINKTGNLDVFLPLTKICPINCYLSFRSKINK